MQTRHIVRRDISTEPPGLFELEVAIKKLKMVSRMAQMLLPQNYLNATQGTW